MIKGLLKEFSEKYLADHLGCLLTESGTIDGLNIGYTLHLLRYVYEDTTKEKIYNTTTLLGYLLSQNFDIIYWNCYYIVKFEGDMIVYVKGFDSRPSLTNLKDIDNWYIRQNKR